ncbi:MAG: adenylosuccinate lyase [Candidatus Latescibacteria bacterium 4484_7]|nr:MAG: adenylosuccinate lyase [Candidatus Latescibacteria bacterium 4484_7]
MIPRYSVPEISEIWSDEHKFDLWREIEVLYCEGMAEAGLIPKKAAREIRARAGFDIKRIAKLEATLRHDVVAFLTNMSEHIGPSGRYLHMGMTSSDLLDTALACQLRDSGNVIMAKLKKFRSVLRRQANRYKHTPMIGRTHGIHAEPITFGLKVVVWYTETERNIERLRRAIDSISVGKITGAVGTITHIDPRVERYVMRKLKLKVAPATTQIIQRDVHAEFVVTLALIGSSLEKMATEIRALQRTDIQEAEEPFTKGQKGSSAMPHKRNPILSERICGMARVLRANSIAAMENVALWHERDISHSSVERIILPDSTSLLAYMLDKFKWIMENLVVDKKRMRENMERTGGLVFSQHILLFLVKKGFSREEAYAIVQGAAMESCRSGRPFKELIISNPSVRKCCSAEEIEGLFSLENHLKRIDLIFERAFGKRH